MENLKRNTMFASNREEFMKILSWYPPREIRKMYVSVYGDYSVCVEIYEQKDAFSEKTKKGEFRVITFKDDMKNFAFSNECIKWLSQARSSIEKGLPVPERSDEEKSVIIAKLSDGNPPSEKGNYAFIEGEWTRYSFCDDDSHSFENSENFVFLGASRNIVVNGADQGLSSDVTYFWKKKENQSGCDCSESKC